MTRFFALIRDLAAASRSLCTLTFRSVYLGKISLSNCKNKGISQATNLERFISRRVLHKIISSEASNASSLLLLPAVLSTDRILRKPKS